MEARLLPRLAPTLPVEIPVALRTGRRWILTRRIHGTAIDDRAADELGEQLATFLRALHAFPRDEAEALGVPTRGAAKDCERFRTFVLPLLHGEERRRGAALLVEHERASFEPALTHADLGPTHVLVDGGRISGVIDWTDASVGDPAIDLAWALYGTPQPFGAALAAWYGVDADLARRARVHWALGPWHEVVHGLRTDRRFVASGLDGVRARLRAAAEADDTMPS